MMLSQAMESVTRAFYARGDLDLILTSPATASRLFAVRIVAMAVTILCMALVLAAPFINVLVWRGGAHWLGAYAVAVALAMDAVAVAVVLTVALFRTIGPRRTRAIAQIVAAVIGAAFVIGIQFAAISSLGTISRAALLQMPALVRAAPDGGQRPLVAGPCGPRRAGGAGRPGGPQHRCAGGRDRRLRAALRPVRAGRRRRAAGRRATGPAAGAVPQRRRPRRRCAARSGRCCCAIPG